MNTSTTVLGYPRIGPRRELKHALEQYWATGDSAPLEAEARRLRAETWLDLKARGLDTIPGNTFSYYDQMLDQIDLSASPRTASAHSACPTSTPTSRWLVAGKASHRSN